MNQDFEKSAGGVFMPLAAKLVIGGVFDIEHVRDGKVIDKWSQPNLVTNEGLNKLLGVMFNADTQITTWYLAPFEGNYTPVAGLTAANFTANATECTAYDESTRVAFVEAAPSSQSITNSANRATFTFNATKTIYGVALLSDSAKSSTSGVCFSATRFSASKAVVDNDELLITYTFSAASA